MEVYTRRGPVSSVQGSLDPFTRDIGTDVYFSHAYNGITEP